MKKVKTLVIANGSGFKYLEAFMILKKKQR
jgi:hypothetical protein